MNTHAIILAAGKGTRMKLDVPKCAVCVCGKPMVCHIISALNNLNINDIVLVVGYKADEVKKVVEQDVKYAYQEEQNGTAHATKIAKPYLSNLDGITLIFPGDVPFVGESLINDLIKHHQENNNALTLVTTILDDAKSYGRIYREDGAIKRIIEFKDCNPEQLQIKEINSGIYCVNTSLLFDALEKINNHNNAKEYYLTDIIEILSKDYKVDGYIAENNYHLLGVNSLEDKELIEKLYREENGC